MKEKGDIKVTLGIPAYGRVGYLREAVASALKQKVAPDEIIISQNAHPDAQTDRAVRDAMEELAAESPIIRLNRNESRCNLSTNINSIGDLASACHAENGGRMLDLGRYCRNSIGHRLQVARHR